MTAPVGSFSSSPWPWLLYDTAGNVLEWVEDAWHDSYEGAPIDGSTWEDEKSVSRVLRGGSWSYEPGRCRAAHRGVGTPDDRDRYIGFRVCCGAPIE